MPDDSETQEHFIGFTIAELTVIATALLKHQEQTDRFVGFRGATRFHTSAVQKIEVYCRKLAEGRGPS